MSVKRGQNEGSVYERQGDGRWVAVVTLPDGRRKQHYAATKKGALLELKELGQRLDGGLDMDASQTVAHYLVTWLVDVAKDSVTGCCQGCCQNAKGDANAFALLSPSEAISVVPKPGLEPGTPAFSVRCSTN